MNCDGDVEGKYVQWLDRQTFKFVQATGQGDFKTMLFYFDESDRKTAAVAKFFRNAQLGNIYVFSNCLDRTSDLEGLAGVKEARRGVIRAQAPTYLFKIMQDSTFLAKKSEAKRIIYEPALVCAEPVPLKTLENYLCEGPFDSNGYARENWPGVIEVKALDTKRAHEKPERAGGDGGQDYVRVTLGDSSSCIHMMFFGKAAIGAARRMVEDAYYRIQHFRLSDKQGGGFSISYISADRTLFTRLDDTPNTCAKGIAEKNLDKSYQSMKGYFHSLTLHEVRNICASCGRDVAMELNGVCQYTDCSNEKGTGKVEPSKSLVMNVVVQDKKPGLTLAPVTHDTFFVKLSTSGEHLRKYFGAKPIDDFIRGSRITNETQDVFEVVASSWYNYVKNRLKKTDKTVELNFNPKRYTPVGSNPATSGGMYMNTLFFDDYVQDEIEARADYAETLETLEAYNEKYAVQH